MSGDRMSADQDRRWPRWVYAHGEEPDYRFSFANERTFLAWIRTALAMLAAGVAVDALPLALPSALQSLLAGLLTAAGTLGAIVGWLHWARSERALRQQRPLPSNTWTPALALVLAFSGAVVLVAVGNG